MQPGTVISIERCRRETHMTSTLMSSGIRQAPSIGSLMLLVAVGCHGTMGPALPAGSSDDSVEPGSSADGTSREGLRFVRDFDIEGRLQAVGAVYEEEADATSESEDQQAVMLAVIDEDTGAVTWPLGDARVVDAALSPRAEHIAFVDDRGRVCHRGSQGDPTCWTQPVLPHGLDVSADGLIVFVADTGIGSNIWLLDTNRSTEPRQLTTGVGFRNRPLFDPSGSRIVYVGPSTGGLASVFRVDLADGHIQQLTNVGLELAAPRAGAETALPSAYIPPPLGRASMSWRADGFHYRSNRDAWIVDTVSGETREEGDVQ